MRASWEYARRGFTLVEMLGVVAILVIALAVALPNAVHVRSDLRMMQLDEQAHQLYNAAQNRLSALQATGQLSALENNLAEENKLSNATAHAIPVDYPQALDADASYWDTHQLCYLKSDDPVTGAYLVTEAAAPLTRALQSGYYIVEFSPLTAEVYSVFYWEDDAQLGNVSAAAITYADLVGACPQDRSLATRTALRIGYYNGGELGSRTIAVKPGDAPRAFDIEVVNSEELFVRITGGAEGSGSLGKSDYDPRHLKSVFLTIDDAESILSIEGDALVVDPARGIDVRFVLDSMRTDRDLSFKTLAAPYPNLTPGADITISAHAVYETDDGPQTYTISSLAGIETFTVNSLFQSNENGTVKVGCVRHLNNLRQSALKDGQSIGNYTTIEVTRDIDFDGTTWSVDGDQRTEQTVSASSKAAGTSKKNLNPLATFEPISGNEANAFRPTQANKETQAVFDGKGFTLENFRIGQGSDKLASASTGESNSTSNAGLFSEVYFKMRDLTMKNVRVMGQDNVGAFAGSAGYNSSFTHCKVSGSSCITGRSNVGGIVGSTATHARKLDFDRCSVKANVSSLQANVGGIVGQANMLHAVTSCSVDGAVVSSSADSGAGAGGIIGSTAAGCADAGITKCTLGCTVTGNGGDIGGIIGTARRCGTISNCTVNNTVRGNQDVGGIIGQTDAQASALRIVDCDVSGKVNGTNHVGGLIGCAFGLGNPSKHADSSYADVSGCTVSGSVASPGTITSGRDSYVAGLVGELHASAQSPVFADCAVTTKRIAATGGHVGGLIGRAHSCGVIRNCSVDTDLTAGEGIWREGQGSTSALGGIVGRADCDLPSIENCTVGTNRKATLYSEGSHVGGIIGLSEYDVSLDTCTARVQIKAGKSTSGYSYAGGLIGYVHSTEHTGTNGARLANCTVQAGSSIYAQGMCTGGLSGYFEGSASQCRACADIEAEAHKGYSFAGGAFGVIRNSATRNISSCRVGTSEASVTISAAGSHVGGFAATAQQAHISKGRVYGATASNGHWYRTGISGTDYTGGFLGMTGYLNPRTGKASDPHDNGLQIITSFSALNTTGTNRAEHVGGFVGYGGGGSVIAHCYASGKVRATSNVGGFAGTWANDAASTAIDSCYTTSNTTGTTRVGGFVGTFERGSSDSCRKLLDCVSYGEVMATHEGAAYLGGFAGQLDGPRSTSSASNYYDDGCAFLKRSESGYNNFESTDAAQPKGLDDDHIANLFSTTSIGARDSHPYADELQGHRFPYGVVVYEGTALPHYGDWPLQVVSVR